MGVWEKLPGLIPTRCFESSLNEGLDILPHL